MSITRRVKRLLSVSLAGAMVFALMPAGVAAAAGHVIDTDALDACEGSEGLVEFDDALGSFASEIECMAAYGITVGQDGSFNPAGSVTRAQMAVFIARLATQALNGNTDIPASEGADAFPDIADTFARDAINYIEGLEIVEGFGDGDYAPSEYVTREQMASFIARAHIALEVDLTAFEATAGIYDDEDSISAAHLTNVLLLTDVGVIAGQTDGNFNPGAFINRSQMSLFVVRSISVLDGQGLWNGEFTVALPSLTFTVLEDDTNITVNLTGVREGTATTQLGAGDNLIPLSDGDAVSVFQFSVPEDDFSIEGAPATPAAFLAALELGDTLVATPTADGFAHDLSPAPAFLTEGVVGNVDLGAGQFDFLEPASGESLFTVPDGVALGQEYTVDGAAVTQAEFLDELSVGDYLEAEVLAGTPEADGSNLTDLVYRHNLTNRQLVGEIVAEAAGSFTVDANPDDDGVFGSTTDGEFDIAGYVVEQVDAGDDYDVTVVSTTTTTPAVATFAELLLELADGDEIVYARSAAEVVTTITVDTSATVYTGTVETIVDAAGEATIVLMDGSAFADALADYTLATRTLIPATNFTTFRVDGAVVLESDLIDLVSIGDSVTATLPFGENPATETMTLSFTTGDVVGTIDGSDAAAIDTAADELLVDVSDSVSVTITYDALVPAWNLEGSAIRYFVDDVLVIVADFETALTDAATADAEIGFELVDTGTQVQYRITTS